MPPAANTGPSASLAKSPYIGAMSDAPRRPVVFDAALVRAAYRDAGAALLDMVAAVPQDAWDRAGLGEWTVRDLVGHAGRSFVTVSEYLRAGEGQPLSLRHSFDYGQAAALIAADPGAVTERGRAAGRALGQDPVGGLTRLFDNAVADVAAAPDEAPCATLVGVMRLVDYLPSRIFELIVHTDDLAQALGTTVPAPVTARVVALTFAAGLAGETERYAVALRALTGRGLPPGGFSVV